MSGRGSERGNEGKNGRGNEERASGRSGDHWGTLDERQRRIGSIREKVVRERRPVARAIDHVGRVLSSPPFFAALTAAHLLWIVANLGGIPGLEPWDPYPFTFLATLASVEAPIIALLILMRQERDRRVDELRNEVNLQVSLHVEQEQTVMIRALGALAERLELDFEGREDLQRLQEELDTERLVSLLEQRLEIAEDEEPEESVG